MVRFCKGHFHHESLVNPRQFTNVYVTERAAGIQDLIVILGEKETLKIKPDKC